MTGNAATGRPVALEVALLPPPPVTGEAPAGLVVGRPLAARLTARLPPGHAAGVPAAPEEGTVVARFLAGPQVTELDDGGTQMVWTLEVIPFATGQVELPALELPWTGPAGATGTAATTPLPLEVLATVDNPETATPADIAEPMELPLPGPPGWMLALLLVLVASGILGFLLMRRRRVSAGVPAGPPPDPFQGLGPAEWALRELQALDQGNLLQAQGVKPFHVRLATVLRTYLAGQFGLDTLERTTLEILQAVERELQPLPGPRERLRQVLGQCDLVKFARQAPDPTACHAAVASGCRFVQETRPQPAAEPAVQEAS